MKCPKCSGTGEMQICEMGFIGKDECDKCHGKGYLNNEEWLRQANTEQLAEFISKIDMSFMDKAPFPCGDLIECNKNCGLYSRCVKDDFPTNKEVWVEWLKQPHTFE